MKHFILMSLLIVAGLVTFQQEARCQAVGIAERESMKRRLKGLRKLLDTPPSIPITVAKDGSLSRTSPLKIYLLLGGIYKERFYPDKQVYDNYLRWFNEWNHNEGKANGILEPVTDISQADVILVRYFDVDLLIKETRVRSYPFPGYVPYFGYLINLRPDGLEIFSSWANDLRREADKDSGELLGDRLFKLMKERTQD
jgi:hypothetical protein